MKYKVWVYVICYNESKLAPFVIDYWKRYASHVVVYDNGSNDGTLEILQKYPNFIEIRSFDTNNTFDDRTHMELKNSIWKETKGKDIDFVQVSDFDEVLTSNNFEKTFNELKDSGCPIWASKCFELYSKEFPEYNGDILLHESNGIGFFYNGVMSKCILFDPNIIEEINYSPGAHKCNPLPKNKVMFKHLDSIKMLHLKYLSLEYVLEKNDISASRLSNTNIKNRWGFQYLWKRKKIEKEFFKNYSKSVFAKNK